jgi:rubrerythrin
MTDQTKTLQALQLAIRMEIDGKAFYLKASQESTNALGKKLLATLSSEEDMHRQTFESIYEALRRKKGWPAAAFHPDRGKTIRSVFAEAGTPQKPATSEMDAIKTAKEMELKSISLYRERAKEAADTVEKAFYETLAGEEEGHHLALVDYEEYLTDPTGWFTMKERHSLDGG